MPNTKTHHNVACQLTEYCKTDNPLLIFINLISSREDKDYTLGLYTSDTLNRYRLFFLTSPIKIRIQKSD